MLTFNIFNGFGDFGLLALRIALGAVFIYHGLPKLKNSAAMAKAMGKPASFVLGLGAVEALGGIAALVGFYTQVAALLLALVMVGAAYMKMAKWKVPFAAHDKTGWELDLVLLAAAIALVLLGAGAFSVDHSIGLWP